MVYYIKRFLLLFSNDFFVLFCRVFFDVWILFDFLIVNNILICEDLKILNVI